MADDRLRAAERALLELPTREAWAAYSLAWERSGRAGRHPMLALIAAFDAAHAWPRDPRRDPRPGDVVERQRRVAEGEGEGEPEAWRVEAAYYSASSGRDEVLRQRVALRADGTPGRAWPRFRDRSRMASSLDAWGKFSSGSRVIWIADPFGRGRA